MTSIFYTVGHSTRTVEQLVKLLRVGDVAQVVDVRAMPRSRTNPQFNHEALADALAPYGMTYIHAPALAGLRSRCPAIDPAVNGFWRNQSFHNYADYALSEQFQDALAWLRERGARETCAIMCAEAVWWRCHRRIIADHLLHRGERVAHLMNNDRAQNAQMTAGACTDDAGRLVYPSAARQASQGPG